MILRRFMKHVTDQNWFAVGLDVIVVIVGIFLGLQVQDWNDAREAKIQEKIYLQRLHDEVEQVVVQVNQNIEKRSRVLTGLKSTIDVWFRDNEYVTLGAEHCSSIVQSHIYLNSVGSLATITEILNNDRSSEFQNGKITEQITEYILFLERWDAMIVSIGDGKVEISREFSELIKLTENADFTTDFEDGDFICDFELIKANGSFVNHLFSNNRRYRVFVDFLVDQSKILTDLHELIDQELGITH